MSRARFDIEKKYGVSDPQNMVIQRSIFRNSQRQARLNRLTMFSKFQHRALTKAHYNSIGLDRRLLKKAVSTNAKENAACFLSDVDHEGDVRGVMQHPSRQRWLSTMLRQFGHAV
jgi:hypothetical protein